MAIDRIGKGPPPAPPKPEKAGSAKQAGEVGKTFEVHPSAPPLTSAAPTNAPAAATAVGSTPARKAARGGDRPGSVPRPQSERRHGSSAAGSRRPEMDALRSLLREQLASDPGARQTSSSRPTGQTPFAEGVKRDARAHSSRASRFAHCARGGLGVLAARSPLRSGRPRGGGDGTRRSRARSGGESACNRQRSSARGDAARDLDAPRAWARTGKRWFRCRSTPGAGKALAARRRASRARRSAEGAARRRDGVAARLRARVTRSRG